MSAFDNPVNDQRVQNAVAQNLAMHGIQPVAAGATPDCLVGHVIGTRNEAKKSHFSFGIGVGGSVGGNSSAGLGLSTGTGATRASQISVDVFDARSREPLWHGAVEVDVARLTGDNAQKRIDAAMQKMFVKFPVAMGK